MTYDDWKRNDESLADALDDVPEVSSPCALAQHVDCVGGKCACDCHEAENVAMRDGVLNARASTPERPPSICRVCGSSFPNPYQVGESYLCDECLAKPLERPKGVFE